MELKTARLTLLIDPSKKAAFERLCSSQDRTASQVVRQLIRDYLVEHGATYLASGEDMPDEAPESGAVPGPAPRPVRSDPATPKAGSRRRRI